MTKESSFFMLSSNKKRGGMKAQISVGRHRYTKIIMNEMSSISQSLETIPIKI